ncbi:MAG TPA: hypothetical protein PKD53_23900 [Chloroflexaceae bacterium]|nr:hypothetical protein [Chloroflexaceae bacterium]
MSEALPSRARLQPLVRLSPAGPARRAIVIFVIFVRFVVKIYTTRPRLITVRTGLPPSS